MIVRNILFSPTSPLIVKTVNLTFKAVFVCISSQTCVQLMIIKPADYLTLWSTPGLLWRRLWAWPTLRRNCFLCTSSWKSTKKQLGPLSLCGIQHKLPNWKNLLTKVVRRVDSTIHWINHYPLDNSTGFASVYPVDRVVHLLNNPDLINNLRLHQ